MSILSNFHYYCQKVLPLVYDESLSYYEVVCKLVKAMELLDESQTALEKRMGMVEQISTVLWPQFQAEINATLEQYSKAYEDFQGEITADIQKVEADMAALQTRLSEAIASQDKVIQDNNRDQLELIYAVTDRQNEKINEALQQVERNNEAIDELADHVRDFIAQYSPPATINGLGPQFLITANPGATITAVQGLVSLSTMADKDGNAVLTVSNYGEWTVTAEYQGQAKTTTINVDDVKQYSVSLVQQEKTYTFTIMPIPNFSELPSVITQGDIVVSGPNNYTAILNISAYPYDHNVPGPGEYSFDLRIATVYPDASDPRGYIPASKTGVVLYTSTPVADPIIVMPNDEINNTASFTPESLPYFEITLPDDKSLTIASPVTVTDEAKTVTAESTTYKFVPWVTGNWGLSSSDMSLPFDLDYMTWAQGRAINVKLVRSTITITLAPLTPPHNYAGLEEWYVTWNQGGQGGTITCNSDGTFNGTIEARPNEDISLRLYANDAIGNADSYTTFSDDEFEVQKIDITAAKDLSHSFSVNFIEITADQTYSQIVTNFNAKFYPTQLKTPLVTWCGRTTPVTFYALREGHSTTMSVSKYYLYAYNAALTVSLDPVPAFSAGATTSLNFPWRRDTTAYAEELSASNAPTYAVNMSNIYRGLGFCLVGLANNGDLIGLIPTRTNHGYQYEDGSYFNAVYQKMAIYMPAHKLQKQFGTDRLTLQFSPTDDIDGAEWCTRDFSGTPHKAIAITLDYYDKATQKFPASPTSNQVAVSPKDGNHVPFGEIIRLDQLAMLNLPYMAVLSTLACGDGDPESDDYTSAASYDNKNIRIYNLSNYDGALGTSKSPLLSGDVMGTPKEYTYVTDASIRALMQAEPAYANSVAIMATPYDYDDDYFQFTRARKLSDVYAARFLPKPYMTGMTLTDRVELYTDGLTGYRLVQYID